MLWALQVVCRTTEAPPGLQRIHLLEIPGHQQVRTQPQKKAFTSGQDTEEKGLGSSPSSAVTLISTKTSFPLFTLFSTCFHKGYRSHKEQLLSAQGIWEVWWATRRGWHLQAHILFHVSK